MFVIVPNSLRDEINRRIDEALAGRPATADDRQFIYTQILNYYDEHGRLPDFELRPSDDTEAA